MPFWIKESTHRWRGDLKIPELRRKITLCSVLEYPRCSFHRPCVLPSISLHLPNDSSAENKRTSNDYGIKRGTALLTEPDISLNEGSEERGCLHLTGFRMAGMHAGFPNSSSDLSLICQDDPVVPGGRKKFAVGPSI